MKPRKKTKKMRPGKQRNYSDAGWTYYRFEESWRAQATLRIRRKNNHKLRENLKAAIQGSEINIIAPLSKNVHTRVIDKLISWEDCNYQGMDTCGNRIFRSVNVTVSLMPLPS